MRSHLLLLLEHDLAYGGLRGLVVLADVLSGVHLRAKRRDGEGESECIVMLDLVKPGRSAANLRRPSKHSLHSIT